MALQSTPSIFGNGRCPTGILHLKGKVFEFFKLPLELRQLIYDAHLQQRIVFQDHMMRATLSGHASTNLLLVSCSFRRELEERSSKLRNLIIEGRLYDDLRCLPRALQSGLSMQVHLILVESALQGLSSFGSELALLDESGFINETVLRHLPRFTASEVSLDLYLRTSEATTEDSISDLLISLLTCLGGMTFKAFNVFLQDCTIKERICQPWETGFHHKDDKLIIRYSEETKRFEYVEDESSNAEDPATA